MTLGVALRSLCENGYAFRVAEGRIWMRGPRPVPAVLLAARQAVARCGDTVTNICSARVFPWGDGDRCGLVSGYLSPRAMVALGLLLDPRVWVEPERLTLACRQWARAHAPTEVQGDAAALVEALVLSLPVITRGPQGLLAGVGLIADWQPRTRHTQRADAPAGAAGGAPP